MRADRPLPDNERRKIALFATWRSGLSLVRLTRRHLHGARIYNEQKLDDLVVDRLHLDAGPIDLSEWDAVTDMVAGRAG